ncbi:MAG: hypothetical protein ACOYN0_17005 [Phycisphaerales bacterium]
MSRYQAPDKDPSHRTTAALLACFGVTIAALPACETSRVPSTAILSRDEFARTVEVQPELVIAGPLVPEGVAVAPVTPGDQERITLTGPIAASSGIVDAVANPGNPQLAPQAATVADSVLVDAKIGDINGRAIYASEFLDPMSDRLRAEAAKQPRDQWMKFARTEISRELDAMIEDELLTAEALASFTPEQKAGFFAFVQGLSRRMASENLGSRTLTDKRMRESEGKSLDEMVAQRRDTELVKFQLQERIYKRVNVSWRDILQTYDRYYDEFNPAPKFRFRLIQLNKDNAAGIEKVTKGLGAGESFETLAISDDNLAYFANKEQKAIREVSRAEDPAKTVFFVNKTLNTEAAGMSVGEVRGPFPTDPTVTWMKLEEMSEEHVELYDAQLRIETFLRSARNDVERRRYVARLRQRASITDDREMAGRLLEIAADRYYPERTATLR